MANTLPPPPINSPPDSFAWKDWYVKLQQYVSVSGIPWTAVDKTGSSLADLATRTHNSLQSISGGAANDYYHLTAAQHAVVSVAASGTYTPTLTNVTNLAASTAYQCQYMRIGSVVTVSGKVDVDPTAAGSTVLGLTLPVASNLGAAQDCAGTAACPAVAGFSAAILGDTTNDRAQIQWIASDTANQSLYFTFTYRII